MSETTTGTANWLVPLCNVAGTLLLLAGLGLPALREHYLYPELKAKVEATAREIVAFEVEIVSNHRGNPVLFPAGEIPDNLTQRLTGKNAAVANSGFLFETYVDEEGFLVVQATPGDKMIKESALPLEIFRFRKSFGDKADQIQWTKP